MSYHKWTPLEIADLIREPIEVSENKHPDKTKNQLQTLRRYYINKLGEADMEKPPTGNGTNADRVAELLKTDGLEHLVEDHDVSFHVGYIKNSEGEIEYTKPLASVRARPSKPTPNVDDLFPQVESSVIKPTKRRRAQRLGQLILGYGDGQVDFRIIRNPRTLETKVLPLQNLEMHRIILQMNAHFMPETTINGGDFGDFSASSRFPTDSDHFNGSMTLAMQWIHDFYSQMVADNPNLLFGGTAQHVEVASNHADRPRKKVLREMPELYNFYRPGEDYPAHTYYSMAKLGELGIIHPTGYPHGEYIYGDPEHPQILFKHGSITGNSAVYREADKNPTINMVRWHNHGERKIKRTTREGRQLFYLILGSSCLNGSNVPGFHSAIDDFNQPVSYHNQDHVNSFVMIRDYGGGRFEPVTIDVVNGKAYYDGMEWDGTQPYEWEKKYGYIEESKGNE